MMGQDEKQPSMMAVCGLDCGDCDIREATNNVQLAIDIADILISKGYDDVEVGKVHCGGCKGDREIHWGGDCWILKCCVDDKGLDNCSLCDGFPCDNLVQWATLSERYTKALNRLKRMRGK